MSEGYEAVTKEETVLEEVAALRIAIDRVMIGTTRNVYEFGW